MLGLARPVSLLGVLGGGLWLVSYVALVGYRSILPVAVAHNSWVGLPLAAMLLAVAVVAAMADAGVSRRVRAIVLTVLVIAAAPALLGLLPIPYSGDEDLAWGVVDLELVMWTGYASFMGAMTLLSIAAIRTARSVVEILGWTGVIIGAAGQAVLLLLDLTDSTLMVGDLLPTPIVLFGVAWIAIGFARLQSTRMQNQVQAVHQV
jgi:hypothetical protein